MRRPRVGAAALLVLAVVVPVATTSAYAALPAPVIASAPAAPTQARISVSAITPEVAGPGRPVTVTGTVRNTGRTPLDLGAVRLYASAESISTPQQVELWMTSTDPVRDGLLATSPAKEPLAPGAQTAFTLRVDRPQDWSISRAGVLLASIEAADAVQHTFLGFERSATADKLPYTVLAPLTVPADPALLATDAATRATAWQRLSDPASPTRTLLTAGEGHDVAWILDPTLVQPPASGAETPSGTTGAPGTAVASAQVSGSPGTSAGPTQSAGGSSSATPPPSSPALSEAEATARGDLRQAVTDSLATHPSFVLPLADPDLTSVGTSPPRAALDAARRLSQAGTTLVPGAPSLAWPVDGRWTPTWVDQAAGALGDDAVALLSSSTATQGSAATGTARVGDRPVLVADSDFTDLLVRVTTRPGITPLDIQQLVAASAVRLPADPIPGRRLVIAPARGYEPDGDSLARALQALESVPWLEPVTVPQLTEAARNGPRTLAPATHSNPRTPSPLTTAAIARLTEDTAVATAYAAVRADGATTGAQWRATLDQLWSARWRGHQQVLDTLAGPVEAALADTRKGIQVVPTTIAFFADTGRVQLTIRNDLPTAVDGLRLALIPDRPLLRVESTPAPLRIGAKSRTTVTVEASALAQGPVHLRARLTTPDGTPLHEDEVVTVDVTPTGTWLYWVIGGVGGTLLLLGFWRGAHARRKAARAPEVPAAPEGADAAYSPK